MAVIPKIRAVCHCNDATLDASCLEDLCVQNYRMAGACECTCKVMLFQACTVFTPIADCSCIDGTTKPGQIIDSVWVGWIDASAGKTLADIAALTCDGDSTVTYRLFGFEAGEWTGCITSGGHPIKWDGVNTALNDLPANALVTCSAGVANITATDFNLTIVPTPGGTGSDCTQTGGYPVLAMQASDQCGHTLIYCPFAGVSGQDFACMEICCVFAFETGPPPEPDPDPSIGHLIIYYTLAACDCRVITTLTVTSSDGGSMVYTLDSSIDSTGMIDYSVTFSGSDVTVSGSAARAYDPSCEALCPDHTDTAFTATVPLPP